MSIIIDKQLPVAIQTQIVGAIEYSIMAGELRPGTLLPSVRVLSRQLGVAQLTVSYAYTTLKTMGLIKTVPGKGTYVLRERQAELPGNPQEKLRQRFMQLLSDAQTMNISPDFFQQLLTRVAQNSLELACPVAYVGHCDRVNQHYLDAISQTLGMALQIDSYTFTDFNNLDNQHLSRYGLVLTQAHRIPAVRLRLGRHIPVYAPWLILSPGTRQKLANIPAGERILLVARHARFLTAMMRGVKQHAPQAGDIEVATLDDRDIAGQVRNARLVIYSPRCHQAIQQYPADGVMLEYRHIPDPDYLHAELSPVLRQLAQ